MKKMGIFGLLCLMTLSQQTLAVENVRSLATDRRIKVVAYQDNNVVPVHANTFTTTQIIFAPDEVIENIQNGDLDAWTVSVQKGLGNMLFLKPTLEDSDTNMTIVTNRHTYYFHLVSHKKGSQNNKYNTYAIRFSYPNTVHDNLLANLNDIQKQKNILLNARQNPKNYHWDYSFNGSRSIMPQHIFDDGRFTYLQLRANQPIPAIFAVDNKAGKESVVNYRREGSYLVIQQTAPQFTLREGMDHVANVFNNLLIRQLEAHEAG